MPPRQQKSNRDFKDAYRKREIPSVVLSGRAKIDETHAITPERNQNFPERARSHNSLQVQAYTNTMKEITTVTHDIKATKARISRNFIGVSFVGLLQI